ncbi:cell division protein ZapE [Vibrio sp. CAIM 722]|uniref:Cell division protein ZapE n=1 Tax=Vibrio eleionomae TaxID=2653505 RepID=A0A7X4LH64_9VIBR|nr:cell division protein ZapE [Vibrio eleionomae]MZI91817.1 cell division protein ZapE [Vibrio eleionomae]
MTPKQRYEQDLTQEEFKRDDAQALAVNALDTLYHQLVEFDQKPDVKPTMWQKLLGKKAPSQPAPKGLYFWGGVGRGKTYLMDTFYDALPIKHKMRSHFHRFMLRVHNELSLLHDVSDPLDIVADKLAAETKVICFDEFFVSDITDAMILGTLFQALFERHVILVATSNIPPKDLYRNGLQRARFLPAIALIEANCHILNVDGGVDYRLRTLTQAEIYHSPLDDQANASLQHYYQQFTGLDKPHQQQIEINHRQIDVTSTYDGVLFATFAQLCQTARSQNDYIEMSRLYHTVILADVRQMGESNDDAARRFIALVDEFYERHVKLIISAEVELEALYTHGLLEFEFQRCRSRLIEMQSQEYLARDHLI